ncbi:MAG: hypothetical protein J5643_08815 [Lachnospiraceae bacterium]|nr:hypothetical protein [Lachnospiraceae bacterium]
MKSIDEQMMIIENRSDYLKSRRQAVRFIVGYSVAAAVFVALLIGAAVSIPKLRAEETITDTARYGSLILTAPYMGYVIVGLITFILGILVALLCKQIRDMNSLENKKS